MNSKMLKAKKAKNDEFYTQYKDIEKELEHYKAHLVDKTVYCNCDNPEWSNFPKYFRDNFEQLGVKKLITSHYSDGFDSYKTVTTSEGTTKTNLIMNGDFRSPECIEILKEADIVITNPPFSLFREYVAQLIEYKKKFLIIGNMNAITYKETFKLIKNNELWLGNNAVKEFIQPDKTIKKFGNILWFTNLEHSKRNGDIILYETYKGNEDYFPHYDNYDAINVNKVNEIPKDYTGAMGVPITFLGKHNPEQFEILGLDRYIKGNKTPNKRFTNNNKERYARIVIKNKHPEAATQEK